MDESTELMLTMMGAFAQAESESISGNIQAGKRYAMQRGEATINYHNLYAYEKGTMVSRRSFRNRQRSSGRSTRSTSTVTAST